MYKALKTGIDAAMVFDGKLGDKIYNLLDKLK